MEKEKTSILKKWWFWVCIVLIVCLIGGVLYFTTIKPYNLAVKEYNQVVAIVNEKNKELDENIQKIEQLIDTNEKVIDENIITNAKDVIKKAGAEKVIVDKRPSKTNEIKEATQKYSTPPDYTENIKSLNDIYNAYTKSIKQYKQLTNPAEAFIIQRLKTIDEVLDVRAVTEDNDPNGKLNKAGGYTATVYFSSKNVNQNNVFGDNLIDKGTNAGGAVEVYANEEDAKKRQEYLSAFDGSVLSSGTHTIVGTVLIRTSDELSASKQKELEEKIINAFIKLDNE